MFDPVERPIPGTQQLSSALWVRQPCSASDADALSEFLDVSDVPVCRAGVCLKVVVGESQSVTWAV